MRSRTSRGVPEWSGGKDLYIGSPVSAIGTSFGVIGIVPGPPEGSRGPTGWGYLPRGATWAVGVCALAYMGQGHQPQEAHAPRKLGEGRVLKGEGTSEVPWGGRTPPWPHPSLKEGARLRPPSPLALYIVGGREGSKIQALGASLLPCNTSLSLAEARRSPAEIPLHPPPRRRAAGSPSTSPSPLLDQEGGDVAAPYVC